MFVDVLFEQYPKPTRRERFLEEMNRVIPWGDLAGVQGHTRQAGSATDAHGAGTIHAHGGDWRFSSRGSTA